MISFITYYLFKLSSFFLILFPRRISIIFGKFFGKILYIFSKKSRNIAKINIRIAFPDLSIKESEKLLIETFKHYGVVTFEFLRQKFTNYNKINISIDKNTEKILLDDSPLIIMAGHFGNWEMFLPIISKYRKISAIVRKQSNIGGDKFISENRLFKNVNLIYNNTNFKNMLDPLLNNQALLILNDQKPKKRGDVIKFFNEDSLFPKGSGHFYLKSKAKIVFGFCILNSDYSYNFKIKPIKVNINLDLKSDIINDINMKYVKLLEDEIKKYPNQYCWFYKKWDKRYYK